MTLEETARILESRLDMQRLIDEAIENCKVSLVNSAQDDLGVNEVPLKGWRLEQIQIRFHKQSLVFKHGVLSYPYIDTQIGLYVEDDSGVYLEGLKSIGHYRMITLLDGRADDDYLVLD